MTTQASFIGDNLVLYGNLKVQNDLRIDGVVTGNIDCQESVIIGEKAHLDGNITAKNIYCDGKIYGNVKAKQIYLSESATLIGKVQTSFIEMKKNSHFEGEIKINKKEESHQS